MRQSRQMMYSDTFHPPHFAQLPYEIYFRIGAYDAERTFASKAHPWGQLNYCASGVMELTVGGRRFLSPPQYAVWIPPGVAHEAQIRERVLYHSAYIDASLCGALPAQACALEMNGVLKAILADFAGRNVTTPDTPAERRLAQVLLDQLQLAPHSNTYLPGSDDPMLAALLASLQQDLAGTQSLAHWAGRLHVTERTLARRCLRELGMSLGEWRQRQRFLAALALLEQGKSVQTIAHALGYSTASAFIAMFRRHAGTTPEQFRRDLRAAPPGARQGG
ncbi:AraC-like DNA-binding protein [Oxalobacteraceae bacterium GrIS 1.11]